MLPTLMRHLLFWIYWGNEERKLGKEIIIIIIGMEQGKKEKHLKMTNGSRINLKILLKYLQVLEIINLNWK